MKIIDMLNKIANGEKVNFKYDGQLYNSGEDGYLRVDGSIFTFAICEDLLNDEVEIIEEDEKIEHLDIYNCFHIMGDNQISRLRLDDNFQNISDKINEIIDYINKGE